MGSRASWGSVRKLPPGDPAAGQVTLRAYATTWLDQRPNLRPSTVELYEGERWSTRARRSPHEKHRR